MAGRSLRSLTVIVVLWSNFLLQPTPVFGNKTKSVYFDGTTSGSGIPSIKKSDRDGIPAETDSVPEPVAEFHMLNTLYNFYRKLGLASPNYYRALLPTIRGTQTQTSPFHTSFGTGSSSINNISIKNERNFARGDEAQILQLLTSTSSPNVDVPFPMTPMNLPPQQYGNNQNMFFGPQQIQPSVTYSPPMYNMGSYSNYQPVVVQPMGWGPSLPTYPNYPSPMQNYYPPPPTLTTTTTEAPKKRIRKRQRSSNKRRSSCNSSYRSSRNDDCGKCSNCLNDSDDNISTEEQDTPNETKDLAYLKGFELFLSQYFKSKNDASLTKSKSNNDDTVTSTTPSSPANSTNSPLKLTSITKIQSIPLPPLNNTKEAPSNTPQNNPRPQYYPPNNNNFRARPPPQGFRNGPNSGWRRPMPMKYPQNPNQIRPPRPGQSKNQRPNRIPPPRNYPPRNIQQQQLPQGRNQYLNGNHQIPPSSQNQPQPKYQYPQPIASAFIPPVPPIPTPPSIPAIPQIQSPAIPPTPFIPPMLNEMGESSGQMDSEYSTHSPQDDSLNPENNYGQNYVQEYQENSDLPNAYYSSALNTKYTPIPHEQYSSQYQNQNEYSSQYQNQNEYSSQYQNQNKYSKSPQMEHHNMENEDPRPHDMDYQPIQPDTEPQPVKEEFVEIPKEQYFVEPQHPSYFTQDNNLQQQFLHPQHNMEYQYDSQVPHFDEASMKLQNPEPTFLPGGPPPPDHYETDTLTLTLTQDFASPFQTPINNPPHSPPTQSQYIPEDFNMNPPPGPQASRFQGNPDSGPGPGPSPVYFESNSFYTQEQGPGPDDETFVLPSPSQSEPEGAVHYETQHPVSPNNSPNNPVHQVDPMEPDNIEAGPPAYYQQPPSRYANEYQNHASEGGQKEMEIQEAYPSSTNIETRAVPQEYSSFLSSRDDNGYNFNSRKESHNQFKFQDNAELYNGNQVSRRNEPEASWSNSLPRERHVNSPNYNNNVTVLPEQTQPQTTTTTVSQNPDDDHQRYPFYENTITQPNLNFDHVYHKAVRSPLIHSGADYGPHSQSKSPSPYKMGAYSHNSGPSTTFAAVSPKHMMAFSSNSKNNKNNNYNNNNYSTLTSKEEVNDSRFSLENSNMRGQSKSTNSPGNQLEAAGLNLESFGISQGNNVAVGFLRDDQ